MTYYARYYSAGTFVAERSDVELTGMSTYEAAQKAKSVVERFGARPYAFVFLQGDAKQQVGGTHFLGGSLLRMDDVVHDKDKEILMFNMKTNRHPIAIMVTNGYTSHHYFEEQDVVVDPECGEIRRRGDEPFLVAYRKNFYDRWDQEARQD